jgi:hypothetical protein
MSKVNPTAYYLGEALVPAIWSICGVILKPFCLGHYILLEQIGSPFIAEDPQPLNMNDSLCWLFQALLICATTYEENLKILNDDVLHKQVMAEFVENLHKNMAADVNWNIFQKIAMFKEYAEYYMQMPLYVEEHSKQTAMPSGLDWKQSIYLIFKRLGYGESEILNMSLRKLFYEWTSYAEAEGAIKTMNRQDVQAIARAKGLIK